MGGTDSRVESKFLNSLFNSSSLVYVYANVYIVLQAMRVIITILNIVDAIANVVANIHMC